MSEFKCCGHYRSIPSAVAGLKLLGGGGGHHERQSHEVLGSPGECSSGKFLYRGSLK